MAGKRKAEAERWFKQAGYDLKAARWNIEGRFHDTACSMAHPARGAAEQERGWVALLEVVSLGVTRWHGLKHSWNSQGVP
ncbi:MAG: hypothetical protein DDT18_00056 [Actinobacteria bacterium]|nr:hypothetical protein [Actinomycetota bacterium]